jgi:uncharacterized protein (TIGR00297 family)
VDKGMSIQFILLFLMSTWIPLLAWYKKALSKSASLIAAVMIIIAYLPGIGYSFYLVLSFVLVSFFGKIFSNEKSHFVDIHISQKNGTRDTVQVLVNGGIGILSVVLWLFSKQRFFLLCFLTSIAESFGDSMASTVGIYYGGKTYDICKLNRILSGTSGGLSIVGTTGCFLSCLLMGAISYVLGITTILECCIVGFGAFCGCIADSVFGSLFQRKNQCTSCKLITEKETHCNVKTNFYSGISFVNNDVVNLLSNIVSAIIVILTATL